MKPGTSAPLPDARHRHRAATDFERNLVVVAGAGTGKTSLLIERALNALGAGRTEIATLAAITFTEKAAGEMRQRLALGLEQLRKIAAGEEVPDAANPAGRAFLHLAEEAGVPTSQVEERALRAIGDLDRARVETIHAFCTGLLREFPVEAGVDPAFAVDEGDVFEALLEERWERFVSKELGPRASRTAEWERALERVSIGQLRAAAFAMAGFGVPEATLRPPYDAPDPREILTPEARRWIAEIDSLLERQSGMTARTRAYFEESRGAFLALAEGGLDPFRRAVAESGELAKRIDSENAATPNKALAGVSHAEFKSLASGSLRLARNLLSTDDSTLGGLVELLGPFALEAREALLRGGHVSFDGLLSLARDLLRDRPGVRDALKRRHRLLLVDEFQDTDPLQYEIVLFLAEKDGGKASDPLDAELEPGRLFIVGDPKQSIYRFRGADYAAFRRVVNRVVEAGGSELFLTANFRSRPEVLDPINALFRSGDDGCWTESGYQPSYEPVDAVREDREEGPPVDVWTVDAGAGASASKRREVEGRTIAEEIRKMVDDGAASYAGISVLLRSFGPLSIYLRAFREWDIPFVVDGGREFLKRPEVEHLLSILKSLARPSDPVALLAYLRSPAGAVPDTELAAYAASGETWSWRVPVDAARFPGISRAYQGMNDLERLARIAPPDEVVRRALIESELLTVSGAAFEGPQRVANLRKLAASAASLARDGKLSLIEVVESLEAGRTADMESDSPLADEATDAVRIMTVHKAKGLENEVVIVADLAREEQARRGTEDPLKVLRLPDGRQALALSTGDLRNAARVRVDCEESRHETSEEARVLYVALTRAKERLVVIAAPSRRKAPWVEALRRWGYRIDARPGDGAVLLDGLVFHATRQAPRRFEAVKPTVPRRAQDAVDAYERALARVSSSARRPIAAPSEEAGRGEARGERVPSRDAARAAGIVVHRLLERWDGVKDEGLTRDLPAVAAAIAEEERAGSKDVEREAREILDAFLGSPLKERLRSADAAGRELPMLLVDEDGAAFRGNIDLLYREPEGGWVVADFKTDRESSDEALRQRYAAQLGRYSLAVRKALNLPGPPRTELWLLRHGKILAV